MTGYDIFLSDGNLLTTINVKTIDEQANSSLILIGQGIPNYGTAIAQDFVWLIENFAKSTPPVNALEGQEWFDKTNERLNVFVNAEWRPLVTSQSSFAAKFDMLGASQNIDFATVHNVAIFTVPDVTKKYLPNFLVLIPRGSITATTPATVNLSASVAGDVLTSTSITIGATDQYARIPVSGGLTRMATVTHPTITLNVTAAATGGTLHYDAYLFGLTI